MKNSRVGNSIKNIIFSIVSYFILTISNIIVRKFFVDNLNDVYLGLNGVFLDILSILSLAELGIGTSIIYSLYKPIADNNTDLISSLMRFYKKIYKIIGTIIFSIGIFMLFFIKLFIHDISNISEFYLIGFLFIIETTISYYIAYKRSIIFANQNEYIISINNTLVTIITSIIRIIVLIYFKSFILYLISSIIILFMSSIVLSIFINKLYPFLKNKNIKPIDKDVITQLKVNIKSMIYHKIGSVFVLNTDNLLISSFLGLTEVGLFSNYKLILNALKSFISNIFNSITASYGNLVSSSDKETIYITFKRIFFFNYMIVTFCSTCLFSLINPFIIIWLGDKFTFDIYTVIVLVIYSHINMMRSAIDTTKNVAGLYKQDKFVPLIEAFLNLVLSIIFIKLFGVKGVFLGTIFSSILTVVWTSPFVVYKYLFKMKLYLYIKLYIGYFLCSLIVIFSSYYLNQILFYNKNSILYLVLRLIVCIIIFSLSSLIFVKSDNFKYFILLFKSFINKIFKKHK